MTHSRITGLFCVVYPLLSNYDRYSHIPMILGLPGFLLFVKVSNKRRRSNDKIHYLKLKPIFFILNLNTWGLQFKQIYCTVNITFLISKPTQQGEYFHFLHWQKTFIKIDQWVKNNTLLIILQNTMQRFA